MKIEKPELCSQDIGDACLQYLSYGDEGPAIVFMHATGFLPWLWHPIARELSESYRIIAPYFCDHRKTEPEMGGLSWMTLADDLCALCQGLGLEHPYLVGHSMGATVMTIANATHGSIAERMIIIEPIFLPEDFYRVRIGVEDHPLASKSIRRRDQWEGVSAAKEYLRSKALFRKWDDEMLDLYIRFGMSESETGGLQLSCSPRREASLFMGGMQYDPWPLLPKVTCPVLVLEGEESENRQFIDLRRAASLFPRGFHRLVRGAGHLVPMEKPAEIIEIIGNFFAEEMPEG
jgi:lipase